MKGEKHQIDNLTLHFTPPPPPPKLIEEIKKNGAGINGKEMKEKIPKINKTKSWLFEKINKIDKPLPDS